MNWIDSYKHPRNHQNAQVLPILGGGDSEKEIYAHFRAASLNIDQPVFPWVVLPLHLLSPNFSPWLGSFQHRGRRNVSVGWAGLGTAAPLPSRNNIAAKKCPRALQLPLRHQPRITTPEKWSQCQLIWFFLPLPNPQEILFSSCLEKPRMRMQVLLSLPFVILRLGNTSE